MKLFHLAIGTAMAVGVLAAQEPPAGHPPGHQQPPAGQEPRDRTRPDATRTASTQTNDAVLVTWLQVDNENEIALSRIAVQRAQNPDVKQFAQKMIDDHGQILQKLQQVNTGTATARVGADTRRTTDPTNPANRTDPTTGREPATGQPADASGVRMVGALDHERLIRDLGRKCLESATKMLQEKQGAEFDRCYMGMQLGAHMKAVDTIEVFRNYASEQLRPTLDEGLRTVQMHLQHAKDLAKRTEVASADSARK